MAFLFLGSFSHRTKIVVMAEPQGVSGIGQSYRMDMPTLEEYQKAVQIVKDHKICEGCNHLFHAKDIHKTIYWGTKKFWCGTCYNKVKDDD